MGRHIGRDLQGLAGAAAGHNAGDGVRRGRQLRQFFLDDAGLFLEQGPQLGQVGVHLGILGQLGVQGGFLGLFFRFGGLPLLPEQPAEQGQDQQEQHDAPEQGTAVPGNRDRGAPGGVRIAGGISTAGGVCGVGGIGTGDISGVFAGIVSHGGMLRKKGALLVGKKRALLLQHQIVDGLLVRGQTHVHVLAGTFQLAAGIVPGLLFLAGGLLALGDLPLGLSLG